MEINGKKVIDAKKPTKIKITAHDVKMGQSKSPSKCAASLAAEHSIEECLSARVHIGRVYIEHEKQWVRYDTPGSLRSEVIAFDRGGAFEPGEHTLLPISKCDTVEYKKEWRRGQTNRNKMGASPTKGPRRTLHITKVKRHSVTGIRPRGANR